jgi:copper chaperone CopZ
MSTSQELLSLYNKGTLQKLQLPQIQNHLGALTAGLSRILSHNSETAAHLNPDTGQTLQHVRLRVQGMRCEGCAAYLKEQLGRKPGVHSCTVDFASKEVSHLIIAIQHMITWFVMIHYCIIAKESSYPNTL